MAEEGAKLGVTHLVFDCSEQKLELIVEKERV